MQSFLRAIHVALMHGHLNFEGLEDLMADLVSTVSDDEKKFLKELEADARTTLRLIESKGTPMAATQ